MNFPQPGLDVDFDVGRPGGTAVQDGKRQQNRHSSCEFPLSPVTTTSLILPSPELSVAFLVRILVIM